MNQLFIFIEIHVFIDQLKCANRGQSWSLAVWAPHLPHVWFMCAWAETEQAAIENLFLRYHLLLAPSFPGPVVAPRATVHHVPRSPKDLRHHSLEKYSGMHVAAGSRASRQGVLTFRYYPSKLGLCGTLFYIKRGPGWPIDWQGLLCPPWHSTRQGPQRPLAPGGHASLACSENKLAAHIDRIWNELVNKQTSIRAFRDDSKLSRTKHPSAKVITPGQD